MRTEPLVDKSGNISWTAPDRFISSGQGMLHTYDGSGFTKIVAFNMTNKNFFRQMFQEEIIDQGWIKMNSTLAIIMQFYVYNPNLYIMNEKRIIVEFLETGGFINLEHDQLLINMRLYRIPS